MEPFGFDGGSFGNLLGLTFFSLGPDGSYGDLSKIYGDPLEPFPGPMGSLWILLGSTGIYWDLPAVLCLLMGPFRIHQMAFMGHMA